MIDIAKGTFYFLLRWFFDQEIRSWDCNNFATNLYMNGIVKNRFDNSL